MANLNTKTISAGVGDILALDGGVDASIARNVKDGDGTVTPLWLTTTRLGIGTTSPASMLHLSSTTEEKPTLVIEKTGAANHDGGNLHFRLKEDSGFVDTGKEMGDIQWQSYDTTGGDTGYHTSAMIRTVTSGTHSNNVFGGEMQFWTNSGAASTNQRMTITSAGKVGIGDSSPDTTLHVTGSASSSTSVLKLEQLDDNEPFIRFEGTTASDQTKSLSTDTSVGALTGHIRVSINGTDFWVPYYATN